MCKNCRDRAGAHLAAMLLVATPAPDPLNDTYPFIHLRVAELIDAIKIPAGWEDMTDAEAEVARRRTADRVTEILLKMPVEELWVGYSWCGYIMQVLEMTREMCNNALARKAADGDPEATQLFAMAAQRMVPRGERGPNTHLN